MRRLEVFLHGRLAGRLMLRDNGLTSFQYEDAWLDLDNARPLSLSLPLRREPYAHRDCMPFFGGLLPDGRSRQQIARVLGVSEENEFALLERIGADCAGAVVLLPEGTSQAASDERTRKLGPQELAETLRELPRRPLLAGREGVRLSLAGAQEKLPVRLVDGNVELPLGTAASTHILKPASAIYEGLVFNEAFCLSLAHAIGLSTTKCTVRRADDIDYLVLNRFDRRRRGDEVTRIHQEDFCQALGAPSQRKYQHEGGPGLKQCFALLREASAAPVLDLAALLDAVVFNVIIGNNDAHGKNFSLLHLQDGSSRLAPLYDLVSTVFYPNLAAEMAMRIGRQRISERVGSTDLERLAKDAGLAAPLVRRRAGELAETVLASIDEVDQPHAVSLRVAELIRKRAQAFRRRLAKGKQGDSVAT